MIDFFKWIRESKRHERPWVVFGKGPSFERHRDFPRLDEEYETVGLNHACRERKMVLTHMIDVNVLDEVPDMFLKCDYLILPWQPHVKFRPTPKTLQDFIDEREDLQRFERKGRLLWYNASTGGAPRAGSPKVGVAWFSAEAVIRMLAMAGVKKIRTLGIDGGSSYGKSFKDIPPLRGGHTTFDHQNAPIQATVQKFGVDYGPMA